MGAGHAHALYVHEHSPVHRLAPEVKLTAAFVFVLVVAMTPRRAVAAFALDFAAVLAVLRLARIRARFVIPRLAAVAPFLLFAFLIPFVSTGDRVTVLGMSVSEEGLWAMWNVIAKATLGGLVSITLAATTEVPDILRGLNRLRVPAVITTIAMFMVRYLELVAGELGRMRTAMTARGYDPRWLSQVKPIASAAGALFVRSYERGERVYDAMLARGFTGVMPQLAHHHVHWREWAGAALVPGVAILGLVITL